MSVFSNLDYLFEDFDTPKTSSDSTPNLGLAFPFNKLCGELRNNIYASYFANALTAASKKDTQIVKINEHGSLVLPPLSSVSHQIRSETNGYIYEALAKPSTAIHAQIRDYNAKPLIATLEKFSRELDIPKADLVKRTKVFIIGELHYGNLYHWIRENITDPSKTPIFAHEQGAVDGFEDFSVFQGRMSLKALVKQYDAFKAHSRSSVTWRNAATDFYEKVEESFLDVAPRIRNLHSDRYESELTTYVFKTVAIYHHMFLTKGHKKGAQMGGKRKREDWCCKQFDMAQLMYAFHLDCNMALLRLEGGQQGGGNFRDAMDYHS